MVRAPGTGFEFRIFCEGKPLPEYSVLEQGNKVTCWVASQEGKAFAIRADPESAPNPPGRVLKVKTYFDGSNECARIHLVSSRSRIVNCITTEGGIQRKWVYDDKNDDDTRPSEDQIKSLGTIHLRLRHVRKVGSSYDRMPPVVSEGVIAPPVLNERSKKGGGHIISLGSELGLGKAVKFYNTKSIPNMPSLDIIFHYAPKELLIAREIIPKPPSPRPVIKPATKDAAVKREREETDGDASALTDEEEAAAYARLKAKVAAKKRAKITSVKPEPIDISTRIYNKGEIIDISD
ncbi:hypothetical protein BS47DRAFT_289811 [Hydnum rufescens UP504]|uniref:DUF7918 domain-containing protein n=1 Tax=Hydnum rufescens UP504 TaxID=1448309 RepID=A0A9P6AKS5_9AGAM|nr:hypothetical protein BS47DRAFT_289811 [Hydnum rufescens UP504]